MARNASAAQKYHFAEDLLMPIAPLPTETATAPLSSKICRIPAAPLHQFW
jgi:hypothetical protein